MAVCKFFLAGNCRFGDKCKFEHPSNREYPNRTSNQGYPSNNRFSSLQSQDTSTDRNRSNTYQSGSSQPARDALPFQLDGNAILVDLTSERPQWILSAYGPGRQAPAQLFGGPLREQSPEEMRVLHYMATTAGTPQQAIEEAEKAFQASDQQIRTAAANIQGAIDFIVKSENIHPNRLDILKQSSQGVGTGGFKPTQNSLITGTQPATSPFGSRAPFEAPSGPSGFGQASPLGRQVSPFGAPKLPAAASPFGASSAPAPGFGQPSLLGQKSSPFGTPSPVFGAPTQPGGGGTFGQPARLGASGTTFGQPSQLAGGGSAFGQASQLGGGSVFGQGLTTAQRPSQFGAPSATSGPGSSAPGSSAVSAFAKAPSPFSAPAASSSTFGVPSVPAASSPFASPAQPAQAHLFGAPPATSSPFGASASVVSSPYNTSIQPLQASPFAAFTQQTQVNSFGQSSATAATPFGASQSQQTNSFSGPHPAHSGSSAPAADTELRRPNQLSPLSPSRQTGFGDSQSNPSPVRSNSFLSSPTKSFVASQSQQARLANGSSANVSWPEEHPALASYSVKRADGKFHTFKGGAVDYRDGKPWYQKPDRTWEKIWNPELPLPDKFTEEVESKYDDRTEQAYNFVLQHGFFENGIIPLVAPKRAWCKWDF